MVQQRTNFPKSSRLQTNHGAIANGFGDATSPSKANKHSMVHVGTWMNSFRYRLLILRCLVLFCVILTVQYIHSRWFLEVASILTLKESYLEEAWKFRSRKRWYGNPFTLSHDDRSDAVQDYMRNERNFQLRQSEKSKDMALMKEVTDRLKSVYSANHSITMEDLTDVDFKEFQLPGVLSSEEKQRLVQDRQAILDFIDRAGLSVDSTVIPYLPSQSEVERLYGTKPIIYGLEGCADFRSHVPAKHRFVGVAGQMNTGTNALSKYLTENIAIAENSDKTKGVLWTVPWYKHSWISLYKKYKYKQPHNHHDHVMAVILIRDPYFWMQSMCGSPYSLQWQRNRSHCPNLVEEHPLIFPSSSRLSTKGSQVRIRWGPSGIFVRTWASLVEMYNEWYMEYVENKVGISRLVVRFEDLLFHTEDVIDEIRKCVGATWIHTINTTENGISEILPQFQYAALPAKTHPYFAKYKPPSSLISAMIKNGQDPLGKQRIGNMSPADVEYAVSQFNPDLLRLFHYQIDPTRNDKASP